MPLKTVVPPNPESLGWKYSIGAEGWDRSGYLRTPVTLVDPSYKTNVNLAASKNFAMGACGACTLSRLNGYFKDEITKQNFVVSFLPLLDITYYAIASTSQTKERNTLLSILMEIGMKQIDQRPNRLHGPNNMHMMVFDPQEVNWDGVKKYCYQERGSTIWLPLWFKDLSNEEKNKYFAGWSKANAAEVSKRKASIKAALLQSRLQPIKQFGGLLSQWIRHKRAPSAYSPLTPEVVTEIDNLVAHYKIKVPL